MKKQMPYIPGFQLNGDGQGPAVYYDKMGYNFGVDSKGNLIRIDINGLEVENTNININDYLANNSKYPEYQPNNQQNDKTASMHKDLFTNIELECGYPGFCPRAHNCLEIYNRKQQQNR